MTYVVRDHYESGHQVDHAFESGEQAVEMYWSGKHFVNSGRFKAVSLFVPERGELLAYHSAVSCHEGQLIAMEIGTA